MFESLEQPRFVVTQHVAQGQQAFLQWEFHFRMKRWRAQVPHCIHGGTLVHFDAQGRVALHRDLLGYRRGSVRSCPCSGA